MKQSAGILLYKYVSGQLNVLLVHPGGPFWKNKNLGAWSIPKGEFTDDEEPLTAAIREFEEETGTLLRGDFRDIGNVKLKSGKIVHAWALEKDLDTTTVISNEFEIEWPPKSGKKIMIPEIDRAEWFTVEQALEKINPAQQQFIHELIKLPENR
jgi:predicted NUDIX family NTP pyrophosphohydrolase